MRVFFYDQTFDGLLSAVFDAYTRREFPEKLLSGADCLPLLVTAAHTVATEEAKAGRVYRGLTGILSREAMEDLVAAWLSEEAGADLAVFRYIRRTFDVGKTPEHDLADPTVFAVVRLAKRVRCELHRLLGFARFQKTAEGVYFAALAPRHNVLPLMLPHFIDRFRDQRWILYDLGRRSGVLFDAGTVHDVFLDDATARALAGRQGKLEEALLADNEALFQSLWQNYFEATAIRERLNPRLQKRCMPQRYWEFMTEKQ